jgi:hypothetical protein
MKTPIKRGQKGGQGGYTLVTALIFFLAGTAAVIGAISEGVLSEVRTVRNESASKQGYLASESSLEDAIYRIKNGKEIGSSETLAVGTSKATTTVSVGADGSKTLSSLGDQSGTVRSTQAVLETGSGTNLPYALMGGVGGIDLSGGATITGDIYTIGSIRGCSTCNISGMAVSSGKSTSALDQDNSQPSTPAQSINFGASSSAQDLAQSFTVSDDLSLVDLDIYVKKVGSPSNATIKVTTDSGGSPSNTVLASGTLSSSLVSTAYSWIDITLTADPVLSAGTTYWIVIDANNSSSNYYVAAANSGTYASGQAKIGKYNSSWNATSPAGLDMYFQASIGTNEEGITGGDQNNKLPVSSAYSYRASYVSSTGPLYCQVGVENNKSCDTSRADPSIQSDPFPDSLISSLESDAQAGGVQSSSVSVGFAGATLGPKKIVGNLSISNGGTLVVAGTLWVTGNITIDGGALVRAATGSRSYVLIADGTITLSGGASISGGANNHIILVSTAAADPAITINGGSNDTVVVTPEGGLLVTGGAHVKAASAEHITANGGSYIIYDSDLTQLNLGVTSSSTTSFGIKSWKETE